MNIIMTRHISREQEAGVYTFPRVFQPGVFSPGFGCQKESPPPRNPPQKDPQIGAPRECPFKILEQLFPTVPLEKWRILAPTIKNPAFRKLISGI